MMPFKINSNQKIIIYKLLNNLLVVLLIFWGLALMGAGFLPEFISTQFSFLKLTLLLLAIIFLIHWISEDFQLNNVELKKNDKTLPILPIIFSASTLTLSILNFSLFPIIISIIITLAILFYFYKITLK